MAKNKKCDRCGGPCTDLWELCIECADMLETPFDHWEPLPHTNEVQDGDVIWHICPACNNSTSKLYCGCCWETTSPEDQDAFIEENIKKSEEYQLECDFKNDRGDQDPYEVSDEEGKKLHEEYWEANKDGEKDSLAQAAEDYQTMQDMIWRY